MFNLEGLKRYIWYIKRVKYLKEYEAHAKMNLGYFESVRSHNMMRQNIGRADLNMSKLPRVNPKKEQYVFGSSEHVMNRFLEELPKEYEKLRRWRTYNHVSNKLPITGKVIFS